MCVGCIISEIWSYTLFFGSVSNIQLQFAKVIHDKLEEKNKKAAKEVKGVQSFLSVGISSGVEGSTSANCC